jgi:calcineurin-like phosphoesterase family protein
MNIFFTSDLHLSHKNILLPSYSNRPYATLEEHDQALIENWNRVVGPNDVVYFLGDLALCHPNHALEMVSRLRGNKRWIRGNHDHDDLVKRCGLLFEWVKEMADIAIPDVDAPRGVQRIVLNHYAMRVWNRSHYGAWHLYGHSHGNLPDDPKMLSIDVGVDCHNYTPISYAQVKEIMSRKEWTPPDYLLARE